MYILPYYAISALHLIGFSFVNSIKLLLSIEYIFSGITMYYWVKSQWGKKAGFIAGIFYQFAPFHLVDLHFSNDIAHMMTYALIPLNFLLVEKIVETENIKFVLLQAGLLTLLITSHQAIALWAFAFIICYAFLLYWKVYKKNVKGIIYFICSSVLGLLLSIFYWLPILFYSKYIFQGANASIDFEKTYLFLFSPWRMGFLFQGPRGQLSFVIGYMQILVFFVAIFFLRKLKEKTRKYSSYFFIFSSLFAFFMSQQISKSIWEIIPLIKNFQYSYRLVLPISFCLATIGGIFSRYISNKFLIIICTLTILSTILNWGNRRTIPEIGDKELQHELLSGYTPTNIVIKPKWVGQKEFYDFQSSPSKKPLEILNGSAQILAISRTTSKHEYLINAQSQATLKENTFYFPGWDLKINNNPYPINYLDKQFPGIITFKLNKGLYRAELSFTDTKIRQVYSWISLTSLIAMIAFAITYYLRRSRSI
ncbi:hypothetical protein HY041_02390 [Candidatus Roizmanbacteria bacterium]|nr:hypothetical protein [Candidatus Roizmanbacteria bacterium]